MLYFNFKHMKNFKGKISVWQHGEGMTLKKKRKKGAPKLEKINIMKSKRCRLKINY